MNKPEYIYCLLKTVYNTMGSGSATQKIQIYFTFTCIHFIHWL